MRLLGSRWFHSIPPPVSMHPSSRELSSTLDNETRCQNKHAQEAMREIVGEAPTIRKRISWRPTLRELRWCRRPTSGIIYHTRSNFALLAIPEPYNLDLRLQHLLYSAISPLPQPLLQLLSFTFSIIVRLHFYNSTVAASYLPWLSTAPNILHHCLSTSPQPRE